MDINMKQVNGIAAVRVSSTKQGLQGDSPDDQKQQIERFAKLHNIHIKKSFTFIQSASGEIQPNQEAVNYCKDSKNDIQIFLIKSIDRFTRGGAYFYSNLKMQLTKYGVILSDTYGIIGTQTVNTLEHLGVKYNWSEFNPTYKSEILEAERSKDEIRDILTRMIGAEIRYIRMGYRVRQSPHGYVNEKIDTPHGRRVILKLHPIESVWFLRMFEYRIQGNLSDEEIVEKINLLGFKSRKTRIHDKKDPAKILGYRGQKPLTVKQFQQYIQNPIYAGINNEKWADGKPVKEKFQGIVTISMFNQANRGKITIIEDGDIVRLYKGKPAEWRLKKDKNNPLYPYKNYILCDHCRNTLYGSAPRGKSGKHHPTYHCNRKHYFGISKAKLEETVFNFVKDIRFTEDFKKRFVQTILEEWEKRQNKVVNESIILGQRTISISQEIQQLKEKIKTLSSPVVIKMFEEDIEKLQSEKGHLIMNRDNKEHEEVEIETLVNYVKYFMEHLHDLLLGGSDPIKRGAMFGLIFEELPTHQELMFRTPKLACLFKLNEAYNSSKSSFVSHQGLEP